MTQQMTAGQTGQPAPAPTPGPEGGASGGAGGFLNIPEGAVPSEYGRDWHAAFGAAKKYKQYEKYEQLLAQAAANGVSPDDLIDAYNARIQAPPGVPAQAPGLTEARLTEILEKQFMPKVQQALGQSLQDQRQQTEREQSRQQAVQARHEFVVKQMQDLGIPLTDEKGQITRQGKMVYKEFLDSIREHMSEIAPKDLTGAALEDFLARPGQEHLAKAAEGMSWVRDMQTAALSAAARKQSKIAATAGAGAGGAGAKIAPENMSEEQMNSAIVEGIELPNDAEAQAFARQE